jgi:hypothetical protein
MLVKVRTREVWLNTMASLIAPVFQEAGLTLPPKVRISCGWPSSRAMATAGATSRTVGQCWPIEASADGNTEIFVSPCIADGGEAAAILVHELCHAVDGNKNGHKAPYRRIALAVGLTGKMTATHAGPELAERLNALCQAIGQYPHATLDLDLSGRKKQGTRMLKLICPECGYTVRTTAKWIEAGLPTCPCGPELQQAPSEEEEPE